MSRLFKAACASLCNLISLSRHHRTFNSSPNHAYSLATHSKTYEREVTRPNHSRTSMLSACLAAYDELKQHCLKWLDSGQDDLLSKKCNIDASQDNCMNFALIELSMYCRTYNLASFEEMANKFQRSQFDTAGPLPPRLSEVRLVIHSWSVFACFLGSYHSCCTFSANIKPIEHLLHPADNAVVSVWKVCKQTCHYTVAVQLIWIGKFDSIEFST